MSKFTLLLAALYGLSAMASDGKVLFSKGKLFINDKASTKNQQLQYGDTIRTGKKGFSIISIKPGAKIKVKPGTTLIINKPTKIKKGRILHSYALTIGEIFVKATRTKANRYQVRTKQAVMGVRGTQFFVSTSQKSNTWMCVNEGSVVVKPMGNKKHVLVNEGEGVNIVTSALPAVRKYKWTKTLNWKMEGSSKEVEDTTDLSEVGYNIEAFDYE